MSLTRRALFRRAKIDNTAPANSGWMGQDAMEFAIRAPQNEQELRRAHSLLARTFAEEGAPAVYWRNGYSAAYPGSSAEYTRLAFAGEELAGVLRITSETVRLGEARLKVGGLGPGPVVSRRKNAGAARLLLEDALKHLRERKYHLALLFGDPRLHYPLGFTTAFPEYFVLLDVAEGLTFEAPHAVRPAKPGDLAAIQRIHNANDAAAPFSVLRSTAHFTNKWTQHEDAHVITNADGAVLAYAITARHGGPYLDVLEAGAAEHAAQPYLIRAVADQADEANCARLRFHAPPTHCLARYLQQFPSVHEAHHTSGGGGMAALIDTAETLESMIPEWESRLAASSLRTQHTEATLVAGDGEAYRIRAHRGAVDVAPIKGYNRFPISRKNLLELVLGCREAGDIFTGAKEQPTLQAPEAWQLVRTLFPRRTPYVWELDKL
ncbi:MAG: GNAT family N-acetyltransferase [Candidatus Hydrogenedentota bacterium]